MYADTILKVLSPERGIRLAVWPQEFKLELVGGSHRKIFSSKGNVRTVSVEYMDLVNNEFPITVGVQEQGKCLLWGIQASVFNWG